MKTYAAIDLGAESGRVMVGQITDRKLTLHEVHRFPSLNYQLAGSRRWDLQAICGEILEGLRLAGEKYGPIASVSADSWGVDYVLMREGEPFLTPPFHYRDERTDASYPKLLEKLGTTRIFETTGIQFMPINTIYQLADDQERRPQVLEFSDGMLNIADYVHWLLSGVTAAEASLASTTQLYNPVTRDWAWDLIDDMGLPRKLFPRIVPSATPLGQLAGPVADYAGLSGAQVVATCSHDTGAAVAAVPADRRGGWAFLSSGTWSLLGVEIGEPCLTEAALTHNFTNEIGVGNTSRFLKNIFGLWIVQELRREWLDQGTEYSYAQLNEEAAAAEPLRSLVDANDPRFGKPGDMVSRIQSYCRETNQPVPESVGQLVRCALESLALVYAATIGEVCDTLCTTIEHLHIVGGGSQSALLNQMAADATGCDVVAGPVEATAIGNILLQALALGDISSHDELRQIVRNSFETTTYGAGDRSSWLEAMEMIQNKNQ